MQKFTNNIWLMVFVESLEYLNKKKYINKKCN